MLTQIMKEYTCLIYSTRFVLRRSSCCLKPEAFIDNDTVNDAILLNERSL